VTSPLRRTLLPLLVLVAAVGCGGSNEPSSDGTASDTTGATATTAVARPDGPSPAQLGDHAVGRRTVTLTDPDRDGRELTVDVWYPADADTVSAAPKSVYDFIPGVEFTSEVAAADVPVDGDGPDPFLVYSHGSGGLRFVASTTAELLASHGFVVAAPDHTGNTAFDSFLGTSAPRAETARFRPADTAFVISELLAESASTDLPLSGAIDPERIGIYGHSFGGHTALAAVSGHDGIPPDTRIKATVGHAAYTELLTDAELEAIDVPTLLLSGTKDTTTSVADNTERPWRLIAGRPLFRVDITDAGHQSFADVCDYQRFLAEQPDAPAPVVEVIDEFALGGCAPELLDIELAEDTIDTYTVAFLLRHVAGDEAAAAYLTAAYAETRPEVTFSVEE